MECDHRLDAVTNRSLECVRTWYLLRFPYAAEYFTAQVLLAAGRGRARVATCQHTLEDVSGVLPVNRQLLACAVSLLHPGELPSLRVIDAEVFDAVVSAPRLYDGTTALATDTPSKDAVMPVPSRVLDSLQALGWSVIAFAEARSALGLVKRCADTLKELDCHVHGNETEWNEAISRCTRLECLLHVGTFPPAAWLGLSQLHTLLGVELNVVSIATIAAALPRLHTLGLTTRYGASVTAAAVAGFFETLLPRLRVFRFHGYWPVGGAPPATPSQALPLLQELVWEFDSDDLDIVNAFAGAQPLVLCAACSALVDYAAKGQAKGPLSRVRDLRFSGWMNTVRSSGVAAVLRVAPELRTLRGNLVGKRLEWCGDPAFEGLVHRKLRSLRVERSSYELFAAQYDELQMRHFPRLRMLAAE
jgi:hypothetical protein